MRWIWDLGYIICSNWKSIQIHYFWNPMRCRWWISDWRVLRGGRILYTWKEIRWTRELQFHWNVNLIGWINIFMRMWGKGRTVLQDSQSSIWIHSEIRGRMGSCRRKTEYYNKEWSIWVNRINFLMMHWNSFLIRIWRVEVFRVYWRIWWNRKDKKMNLEVREFCWWLRRRTKKLGCWRQKCSILHRSKCRI